MSPSQAALKGPDFICVGLPKAGTGWLFDQLDSHPDFWMPPVKELVYLNQTRPKLAFLAHLDTPIRARPRERLLRRQPRTAEDRMFIDAALKAQSQPMEFQLYRDLFAGKGARLSGDISPPYSNLGDEDVRVVAEALPDTKIILLVRDPVARAWSSLSMSSRHGRFNTGLLEKPDELRAYLNESRQAIYSATKIVERWRTCAPHLPFRPFLFDGIATEPEKTLGEIVGFIGGDGAKNAAIGPGHNRKATAAKLQMSDSVKAVLADHFRDELLACAAMFGGAAVEWPPKYGV